jgi:hypothetical protein
MKHLNFHDFSFELRLPFQKTIRGRAASEGEAERQIETERQKYILRCWDAGGFGKRSKVFECPLNPN